MICLSCARPVNRPYARKALFCWDCLKDRDREQDRAISAVSHAVKKGALPKPTTLRCVDCGVPAAHYDHRDYCKPLDVVPVCVSCNVKRGPAMDSQMRIETREYAKA